MYTLILVRNLTDTFLFLKNALMEHYLEIPYAMMNQTMLNAILMEGIAVETVSTLTIAQNVIVMMKVQIFVSSLYICDKE